MKQKQMIWIAVLILVLCVLLFTFMSAPLNHSQLSARNGVLDLSDEAFDSTVYPLQGEWEFYFGQLYTPADFAAGAPEGAVFSRRRARGIPGLNIRRTGMRPTGFASSPGRKGRWPC